MPGWHEGSETIRLLLRRGRLESIEAASLAEAGDGLLERAGARLATSRAALELGDLAGAYSTAYDAYRITAESLLARQALRATAGHSSHLSVEDAVSAQFSGDIPAFAKRTFSQLRRTRHSVQYFDPDGSPVSEEDAGWAIGKAGEALDGARALLSRRRLQRFEQ